MRISPAAQAFALCTALAVGAAPSHAAPQAARPPAAPAARAVGTWWDRTAPPPGGRLPASRHYSIRSDLGPELTARYADHLDTMYEEYARRLVARTGLRKRSPEVPNVLMFASQQDYLDTLRTQFGINGTGSGGMFFVSPRGAGLAFWVGNLPRQRVEHVVQHEGFHQFAFTFFGNEMPPWLNEGLAEFFGESVVDRGTVVVGQASPQVVEQVRKAVTEGRNIPFIDLLQMDDQRWNANVRGGSAALQYMQSWSMVHFLVYGQGGRFDAGFVQMLRLLNAGKKPYDAMREAFGLANEANVREFEEAWKAHARTAKPGAYVAARGRLEFLAEGLREVWNRGVRPKTLEELKEALREARFQWTSASHGYVLKLDAADDANFAVPDDEVNVAAPAIELVAAKPAKGAKARKLDEEHPLPPMLRTRGLRPNEVGVRWVRNPADPADFAYEILVN